MRLLILLSVLFAIFISCGNGKTHEDFKKKANLNLQEQIIIKKKEISPNKKELINFIKIVDYLPDNYSTLGDIDYTNVIQNILDRFSNIEFPNFPVLVNDNGLNVRSNSKLFFPNNSVLKLKSSDRVGYSILNIEKVQNVTIYGPTIEGDRYRRINPEDEKGEWGMGIWIRSSQNISIYNAKVSKCWGDGIYIGGGDIHLSNDSILIHQAIIDDNRRNGISITSGTNIKLIEPVVSNTHGTSPEAGIDIEPNNNVENINNIYIENPYTYNNKIHGIVVALNKLVGTLDKNVNIEIVNHIDEYSFCGFTIADYRPDNTRVENKLHGSVIIRNPVWKFNKQAYALGHTKNLYPPIKFINSKVYTDANNVDVVDDEIQKKMKSETTKNGIFFQ